MAKVKAAIEITEVYHVVVEAKDVFEAKLKAYRLVDNGLVSPCYDHAEIVRMKRIKEGE